MKKDNIVSWDDPTPEQVRADIEAALENNPSMRALLQPGFIPPMLVSEIPGHRDRIAAQEYVFVQPKQAGWRGMANTRTKKLYTRSGREITTLPHINAALPTTGPEWLDGELYKHGRTEAEIQSMIKRGSAEMEFHVFDCVHSDPFFLRYHEQIPTFYYSPIKNVHTMQIRPDEISHAYQHVLDCGYEGLIIRLDGHGYEHKRSINVFKMKPGTEII